jgi:hypothetical protein
LRKRNNRGYRRQTGNEPPEEQKTMKKTTKKADFAFAPTLEVLVPTSDARELVSNQSIHATPIPGGRNPRIWKNELNEWIFESQGPFGPRGLAGICAICGNSGEGQQGMGGNLLLHKFKARIETSFNEDGSEPIMAQFLGNGEIEITPLAEWDGYTRVFHPQVSGIVDFHAISSALEAIVGSPRPYEFDGELWGTGELRPLVYGSGGIHAVYQTALCPSFIRRVLVRRGEDVFGDLMIPEDSLWMPGRHKLTSLGDEFVEQKLKMFLEANPFDVLSHFSAQLAEVQEKFAFSGFALKTPETTSLEQVKSLVGFVSLFFRWETSEIPERFRGNRWDVVWSDLDHFFENWEIWVHKKAPPVAQRFVRDPTLSHTPPQADFRPLSVADIVAELRLSDEERLPVVSFDSPDWFTGSAWGVICLYGQMGRPTHEYSQRSERWFMQRQYAAFAAAEGMEGVIIDESGLHRVSNPDVGTAPPPCAVTPRANAEVLADSMGGSCTLEDLVEQIQEAREELPASSSEESETIREAPEPTEPTPEEPRDIAMAREICRGRSRSSPDGPQIEMAVVRAPYGNSGRTVPIVMRPDREAVPISKHDLRLFAAWSYLVSEVQRTTGIKEDLFVAIDNTSAQVVRAGREGEECAFCVGQAVVVRTRATMWGVEARGMGPKAYMGKPNNRSKLIRVATHEIAHAITNGEGHGPAWMNAERWLWYNVDLQTLSKEIAKIFRLTAAELTENLPRAD